MAVYIHIIHRTHIQIKQYTECTQYTQYIHHTTCIKPCEYGKMNRDDGHLGIRVSGYQCFRYQGTSVSGIRVPGCQVCRVPGCQVSGYQGVRYQVPTQVDTGINQKIVQGSI